MTSTGRFLASIAFTIVTVGISSVGYAGKDAVPVETVVDYLHAVLQADRTFYSLHIVERLQRKGGIEASENWRAAGTLPLPAQFFQESSNLAALTGVEVRYRLLSLHPINKQSGPGTEFERKGLESVMREPDRPYKGFVTEGGRRWYQALYADHAVSTVCVSCHNAHPSSSKHDYKLNDVLGAVLISIPAPE